MRFHELKGGFQIPLNNEEAKLVKQARKAGKLTSDNMDERDLEVANQLYKKRVFERTENENDTYSFVIDTLDDIWRD